MTKIINRLTRRQVMPDHGDAAGRSSPSNLAVRGGAVTEPRLICRICGVEVTLSSEPTVRMAEVATFYAAHNSHDEGLGVEVTFDTPKQDEELG